MLLFSQEHLTILGGKAQVFGLNNFLARREISESLRLGQDFLF